MSKKVKCAECEHMMTFATPKKVDADNYEYAKHCLEVVKKYFVCEVTNKQKLLNNEQYCRHFLKRVRECSNEARIKKLEDAIAEYEKQLANG
jgi:hypothetical protein